MSHCRALLWSSMILSVLVSCRGSVSSDAEAAPGALARPAAAPGNEIIATIDGEPIYQREVESRVAFRLYQLRADMYSLLKSEAEDIIEKRLLQREALRRGVSVDELLRTEVDAQVGPATDADIDEYLATLPESSPGSSVDAARARPRVAHYLREKRLIERRLALFQRLRESAAIELHLDIPDRPRTELDITGAPERGPHDAAVTLVHVASLTASKSAESAAAIQALMAEYPGKIRWVHRHFVDIYDEVGLAAAKLAILAQDQGRFWELHDRVLARRGAPMDQVLVQVAADMNLDMSLATDARRESELLGRVKEHLDAAGKAGVEAAPTIFVNGRYFSTSFPYERLRAMVAEELGAKP